MVDQPEQALDALKRALTEGGNRLRRSRATLARTEALLRGQVANDNGAGRAGGERRDGEAPQEEGPTRR